ncbi:MAG: DUF1295 domain-containing protein [Thermoleophilia bacterium]|nr:DUF1295 domain-containing protein [Thermoleophilia bacterium]
MMRSRLNILRHSLRASRARGVLLSVAAYVVAVGVAALAITVSGLQHPLAVLGLGTLVATCVVFAVSVLVDNSSVYDPYWSLQPLAFLAYYLGRAGSKPGVPQVVVSVLVFLYALRLTSNFYRDWPGLSKEDFRYVAFRRRARRAYWAVSFFGIHLFPTIAVYLGCLPLYAIFAAGRARLGWLHIVGALVLAAAIILAFVADEQLRTFRKSNANRGKVMQQGIWRYSRHPNYLGEILTWWGLWLFALGTGLEWWWTICGAAVITLLFVSVSIPMMEQRLLLTRDGYAAYQRVTPVLFPRLLILRAREASTGTQAPHPSADPQAQAASSESSE